MEHLGSLLGEGSVLVLRFFYSKYLRLSFFCLFSCGEYVGFILPNRGQAYFVSVAITGTHITKYAFLNGTRLVRILDLMYRFPIHMIL